MGTNLITTDTFDVSLAELLANNVASDSSSYYVFAARHVPYVTTDQNVPVPNEVDVINIYDDMIFGKRVNPQDTSIMTNRYDWTANTSYAMYKDTDATLNVKNFYACVNVGSYFSVYKCLYNNNNAPSTVEPSGSDINPFINPGDGYMWKYMYSASDYTFNTFATNELMPVYANTSIQNSAIPGSIDVIEISDVGLGYDNYFVGSFASLTDIKVGGDPYSYGLSDAATSINNFYNNCIIKITSGAARGEYKNITQYYISGGKRIAVVDSMFVNSILPTDTFEIYPSVKVYDTGNRSIVTCDARAVISPTGNVVSVIDILNPGRGYDSATAKINADPVVPIRVESVLIPIMPPRGGHGADVISELFAKTLGVSTKFLDSDSPLPTTNDFRVIGLMKDPTFANVNIKVDYSKSTGSFLVGEPVYSYMPVVLKGTANTFSNSHVTGANTRFQESLSVGDTILVSDGINSVLSAVASIANNTVLELNTSPSFTTGNCIVSYVKHLQVFGTIANTSVSDLTLTDVTPKNSVTALSFVGATSFATTTANTAATDIVTINGRSDQTFAKFVQLSTLVGTLGTNVFTEDETLYQNNIDIYAIPTAKFHSVLSNAGGPNDMLYVSNIKNNFDVLSISSDGIVTGQSSGSQFILSDKYNGDLTIDSGNVLYLENLTPIARANNKSETIKIFIKFD